MSEVGGAAPLLAFLPCSLGSHPATGVPVCERREQAVAGRRGLGAGTVPAEHWHGSHGRWGNKRPLVSRPHRGQGQGRQAPSPHGSAWHGWVRPSEAWQPLLCHKNVLTLQPPASGGIWGQSKGQLLCGGNASSHLTHGCVRVQCSAHGALSHLLMLQGWSLGLGTSPIGVT